MSKNEKKNSEGDIKNAALRLFSEKGFHNTSTRDITEAAGVSKGSLYWHFKSKEAVAFALVSDMLQGFIALIEEARDASGPSVQRLIHLVDRVAGLYYTQTDHLRLLWKFRADRNYIFSPEYTRQVTSCYLRIRAGLRDLLEQGMASGEFRKMDAGQMAFIILGIAEGLEVEWLENEEEFSMRESLPLVIDMVISGLKA